MVGVGARTEIIRKLGESLVNLKDVFGPTGRPGNLVGKSNESAESFQSPFDAILEPS